ncbi:MAG: YceI family protein [Gemmatimonadetes bacterium]|jgi:polyisoprenoid-binding protein YceI|nr:YceI family protein [Gemmatimonadota bacterium]
MKRWIPALVLVPMLAAASSFAPVAYVRDEAHSRINFIAHSRLVDALGTFDKWDANIMFDAERLENSTVEIVIDAKSINTRVDMRDGHLRSDAFFATDSFPTITFKSAIVNPLGGDRVNITGDLTIRGHTKRITIPSRLMFFDAEKKMGRVKGATTIYREEFGVSFNPPVNPIEPEVEIQFDITFKAK